MIGDATTMSPAQRRMSAHRYSRHAATFANILLTAGLVLALLGGYGAWRGWQTLSWPTADATILSSDLKVEEVERTIPMTDKQRGGIKETEEKVRLAIRYRYAVDGVSFEGDNLEPWDFGVQSEGRARAMAATAAASQPPVLPVAYDPRDHRRAYLVPGPSATALTMTVVGLVLLFAGFLMGRLHRRA